MRTALIDALKSGQEYINPPVVFPVNGMYRVKNGNCRVMAARGTVDSLEVLIEEPPASAGIKLLDQLGENVLQGGLNAMDTARALRRLRDREELSVGGIADLLRERGIGHGRFWVQLHLGLTHLAPAVQTAVEHGDLAARTAWELRSLPPEQQADWCRRIVREGLSLAALKNLAGLGSEPPDDAGPPDEAPAEDAGQRSASAPRSGPLERRWELLPLSLPEHPGHARKLRALQQTEWYANSAPRQRQLAEEVLVLSGSSPDRSIQLAQRAEAEATAATAPVMQTLNTLRPAPRGTDGPPPGQRPSRIAAAAHPTAVREIARFPNSEIPNSQFRSLIHCPRPRRAGVSASSIREAQRTCFRTKWLSAGVRSFI